MSMLSGRIGLALVLAALGLGGRTAHAQSAAYWLPGGLVGFGSDQAAGPGSNVFNFSGFDGGGGFSATRYNFSNGWFVGGGGGVALGMNGLSSSGAFGNFSSLSYQGVQFGYDFKGASSLPIKVFAGFDTFKYDTGIGSALGSIGAMSSTLPGYGAHAGVEFQPTQNLSLSLGVGYTQQSGSYSGSSNDINSSLMPAASLMATSGRR
jgi:hypothetical protein